MACGSRPQRRHVLPSAVSVMEIGCFAPAQWVVSFSVSLSAALYTLKNVSHDTSGTAGGRNAAKTEHVDVSTIANERPFLFIVVCLFDLLLTIYLHSSAQRHYTLAPNLQRPMK